MHKPNLGGRNLDGGNGSLHRSSAKLYSSILKIVIDVIISH